ncbi:hypothetical protein AB6A40_000002 [Gnathostoma spinigerum]|uniref:Nucleolar protein 16 n=1 Tax=Gnathostoma spinigerum TaxID=75299 RepID=A0ABD6E1B8_9BILA
MRSVGKVKRNHHVHYSRNVIANKRKAFLKQIEMRKKYEQDTIFTGKRFPLPVVPKVTIQTNIPRQRTPEQLARRRQRKQEKRRQKELAQQEACTSAATKSKKTKKEPKQVSERNEKKNFTVQAKKEQKQIQNTETLKKSPKKEIEVQSDTKRSSEIAAKKKEDWKAKQKEAVTVAPKEKKPEVKDYSSSTSPVISAKAKTSRNEVPVVANVNEAVISSEPKQSVESKSGDRLVLNEKSNKSAASVNLQPAHGAEPKVSKESSSRSQPDGSAGSLSGEARIEKTARDIPAHSNEVGKNVEEGKKQESPVAPVLVQKRVETVRPVRPRIYALLPRDVKFCTEMIERHGDDYEAMAKDSLNVFQDSVKNIQRKIRIFRESPQYASYLKSKTSTPEPSQ